ncbi:hypothetical protein LWI29_007704 [Acer saccharum]|uniref:Ionotropic glutamate receptor C-terminal domain-containing protein n=1 Tax=Acer saccharum TaxID=4024 RepID=A0AA39SUU2_ACESA|nr:hypothetical protein LWI29_007704 [Acer saccharum]
MKAIAAIIDSWEWHRVTVIYEDTESSTAGIIPHLYDALRESGVEIAHLLPLPPLVSNPSMSEELERVKQDAFGFSKSIVGKASNSSSMNCSLGPVLWPGSSLTPPRGWAVPTKAHPLRIGVPNGTTFQEFLFVDYKGSGNDFSVGGYAIDLFNLTVQNLQYYLPYKFDCFSGTYDQLVQQVHSKNFDAAVGDISIVSSRLEYVEFTHPYTQPGLVMVVPARRSRGNKAWLFMKPFTNSMWIITGVTTIYNGFVVWLIERNHSSELRGSPLNQIGTLIWISFSTLFSLNGEKLHSNLSRMAMVVWLFVALVITQTYTANLSSILTVKKLEATVTNIETLQRSNAKVGYCRGSYLARYLVDVLDFKDNNIRNFSSANNYAEALRTREIEAIFLDVPIAKLFVAKYCKEFIVAGPTYKTGGFGFVSCLSIILIAVFLLIVHHTLTCSVS